MAESNINVLTSCATVQYFTAEDDYSVDTFLANCEEEMRCCNITERERKIAFIHLHVKEGRQASKYLSCSVFNDERQLRDYQDFRRNFSNFLNKHIRKYEL